MLFFINPKKNTDKNRTKIRIRLENNDETA